MSAPKKAEKLTGYEGWCHNALAYQARAIAKAGTVATPEFLRELADRVERIPALENAADVLERM